jgi:cytochrome P450
MATAALPAPPGPSEEFDLHRIQEDSLSFLLQLTDTYGDIVRYTADGWTATLVTEPELVKYVLHDNHLNFVKSGTPDFRMLRPMLGDGLLTSDGAVWLRQRRLAQPAFHRDSIATFATLMTDETEQMLDRWTPLAVSGEAFEVGDELTRLTTRIVARALFSADVGPHLEGFSNAVQALNEFMGHYRPSASRESFLEARRTILSIVDAIIEQRRDEHEPRADFLTTLLAARDEESGAGFTDRQVRDQVMTLLMAGHETTAKALTWCVWALHENPSEADAVRAEIRATLDGATPTAADVDRLPHTARVVQETLRLYPPVWIMSRVARHEDRIGGSSVPAGSLVLVSPYAVHRHVDHWREPGRFHPQHFAADEAGSRHPFAYIPFGAGPRQCIGKGFAGLELVVVLATILQRYELHPAVDTVELEALVTLRPRAGLPVTLTTI